MVITERLDIAPISWKMEEAVAEPRAGPEVWEQTTVRKEGEREYGVKN